MLGELPRLPDPCMASFYLTKMRRELMWRSIKANESIPGSPHLLAGNPNKSLKTIDPRISNIFLHEPLVTPAFIVTRRLNSAFFPATIIFLQIKENGPLKTDLESRIYGGSSKECYSRSPFAFWLGRCQGLMAKRALCLQSKSPPRNKTRWLGKY